MVNDGGGARKEALQEERMLYVWDREEEGAPWRRGSVSAVCFKHKCFALSGTTDTPSEAVQDVVGCLCRVFFFFLHIQRGRLRMETHYRRLWCPLKEHTHTHTHAAGVTFILTGWKEQQVGDGLRSIQVLRAAILKVRGKHAIHNK